MVQLRMTGLTERHEVALPVVTALTYREDVVYLLHRFQPAFLQTHLTEGMFCSIAVTDFFPCPAILLAYVRVPLIPVVAPLVFKPVLLTVLTAWDGQLRTSGVPARSLWFLWHGITSVSAHEKSPAGIPVRLVRDLLFHATIIHIGAVPIYGKVCQSVPTLLRNMKIS